MPPTDVVTNQNKQKIVTVSEVEQSNDFSKERVKDYLDMHNFTILDEALLNYAKELFDTNLITKKLGYPIPKGN